MFSWRLGNSEEFLENIYFTFLFLARAVTKAKDVLVNYPFDTGKPVEDASTKVFSSSFLVSFLLYVG